MSLLDKAKLRPDFIKVFALHGSPVWIQSACTHSGSDGAHAEYRFISLGLEALLPSSLTDPL